MWEPAAELEQRMREALRAGDRDEYFQLLARTELLLPVADDSGQGMPSTWATWATDDRTHVLAFTSPESLQTCLRGHAGQYRTARFTSLAEVWPDPDWWLAVNPGTPIEAYLPAWYVDQLAGGDSSTPQPAAAPQQDSEPAAPEPGPGWSEEFGNSTLWAEESRFPSRDSGYAEQQETYFGAPPPRETQSGAEQGHGQQDWPSAHEVEARLSETAASGDTVGYLQNLMLSWAYLPLAEGAPQQARPGEPDFGWHTDFIDGAHCVTAFTDESRMQGRYGDRPAVRTTFARLVQQWPGEEYSLYVNPGTELGANMSGHQVSALHSWARNQGLLDAGLERERQVEVAEGSDRSVRPELMQKVVPHHQVPLILERGYDRVAGFVHRYEDVADLNTPDRLYRGLGLLHEGSGYSSGDESVHVLRWTGYRSGLYQIAYGGNDPESARASGGWVVEPPPFVGDGYTPNWEGPRIPEYKVDSLRLPHNAVMRRVDADGYSADVAVYDADRREWGPVGQESHEGWAGGSGYSARWERQHA